MAQHRDSDIQMPGYFIYIWAWEKLFGHTELSLRMAVAPFLFFGILLLLEWKRSVQTRALLLVFILLHPFVWYNLNEARSTMIMFFLAWIALLSFINIVESGGENNKREVWTFMAACCIGIMMNMLFTFFYVAIIYLMARTINLKKFVVEQKNAVWGLFFIGMLMGIYYSWTLFLNIGGMRAPVGLQNILGILYEFLGFGGIGPSRNELRARNISLSTLTDYPGVAILTIVIGIFIILLVFSESFQRPSSTRRIPIWQAFFLGFILFILASAIVHFRFWARHISFLLPFVLFGTAEMMDWVLTTLRKPFPLLGAFAAMLILWIVSDINIRWNVEYQKDNYRAAVEFLIKNGEHNQSDWWVGNAMPAEYYGLQLTEKPSNVYGMSKARATQVVNPKSEEDITSYPRQIGHKIVLFKKYDLFDRYGIIRNFIKEYGYRVIIEEQDYEVYTH